MCVYSCSWPISDWLEQSRCPQRRTRTKLSPCGTVLLMSSLDRRNTRHQSTCGTGGTSYFVFVFYYSHSGAAVGVGCHWHIPWQLEKSERRLLSACGVVFGSIRTREESSLLAVAWQPLSTSWKRNTINVIGNWNSCRFVFFFL